MECSKDRLVEYYYDALDEKERDDTERHIKSCSMCREDIRRLKSILDKLSKGATSPASPMTMKDYLEGVYKKAGKSRPLHNPAIFRRPLTTALATAAAAIIIISGLYLYTNRPAQEDMFAQDYEIAMNLELLQDMEVIEHIEEIEIMETHEG